MTEVKVDIGGNVFTGKGYSDGRSTIVSEVRWMGEILIYPQMTEFSIWRQFVDALARELTARTRIHS